MSVEVADANGPFAQVASNNGFQDLVDASQSDPVLKTFFHYAATEDTHTVAEHLRALQARDDIEQTAKGMADLIHGREFVILTRGESADIPDENGIANPEGRALFAKVLKQQQDAGKSELMAHIEAFRSLRDAGYQRQGKVWIEKYSEDQPRDDHGRFGEGEGGSSSSFPSDLKLAGGNSISVNNTLGKKFDKQADAVKAAVDKIPGNMKLAGGSSSRVTLRERPANVPKTAQASFTSAGDSPSGYLHSYPMKGITDEEHGGNAVHEYGHAVDHWVGYQNGGMKDLSEHPGFREAAQKDAAKLGSVDREMRYYHVISSPRETFAETFANIAGAQGRLEDNSVYLEKFSNSSAWIKGALKL